MRVNFDKNGLVPAIVQDEKTKAVLMLGYMNTEAIDLTKKNKKVTFYSRSKKRIWMKGEESGNFLEFISMKSDCDNDTLLVRAIPTGNVCHKGDDTCWGEKNFEQISFGVLRMYPTGRGTCMGQQGPSHIRPSTYVTGLFPQPGLPLGFLLSVKGIGWCNPGGRFPRNGPPVPPAPAAGSPKTAF